MRRSTKRQSSRLFHNFFRVVHRGPLRVARNYVKVYIGRILLGGAYRSFISDTQADLDNQISTYHSTNGGTIEFSGPAYFLIDKVNIYNLLQLYVQKYSVSPFTPSAAWGQSYSFFQDGLLAKSSPRGGARENWSQIQS